MNKINFFKIELLTVLMIIFLSLGFYAQSSNETINIETKASICLNDSEQVLIEMQNNGFSVMRVNDSLKQLVDLYNAQNVLKEKKKQYDFSLVIPYCDEIAEIKENALDSRDKILALKKFYNESVLGLNTSSIDSIIHEIEQEMMNERYEKIGPLVDKAYTEIINVKSQQTTLNLFYESTSRGFKKFLYKNRYIIISFIIIASLLFLIYRQAIRKWLIRKKINKLELRKKNLKDMIMNVQKSYFERGEISEGVFDIRTKKFAELIRDIDRQIPLLQEELEKINLRRKNGPARV